MFPFPVLLNSFQWVPKERDKSEGTQSSLYPGMQITHLNQEHTVYAHYRKFWKHREAKRKKQPHNSKTQKEILKVLYTSHFFLCRYVILHLCLAFSLTLDYEPIHH